MWSRVQSIVYFILSIACFSLLTVSYAADINQGPISQAIPSNIIPSGADNGLSPTDQYQEYATGGRPLRTPVPFDINQCSTGCHFPTNRWFTDLIFQTSTADINFAVAQSPYDISVFDTSITDAGNQYYTFLPGLYLRLNKSNMQVASDVTPYSYNINGDMYYSYLNNNPTYDLSFTVPNDSLTSPTTTTRTITHYDLLSFSTQWKVTSGLFQNGLMNAILVRGSPYITMEYSKLPIVLRVHDATLSAIKVDGQIAQPIVVDAGTKVTGTTFKITVNVPDFSYCDKNACATKDNPTMPVMLRYNQYILFTSQPVTLALISRFNGSDPSYVLQSTDTSGKAASFTGTVRLAYVSSEYAVSTNQSDVTKAAINALNNTSLAETLLRNNSEIYPVGIDLQLSSDSTDGTVIFNWKTKNMSNPNSPPVSGQPVLTMAYEKNHIPYLAKNIPDNSQAIVGSDGKPYYEIQTIKGMMAPVLGSKLAISIPYPSSLASNLWYGDKSIPVQYQDELKTALAADIALLQKPSGYPAPNLAINVKNDSYGFGKQVARVARLALIADQVGDINSRNIALNKIKESLSLWFPSPSPNPPYDPLVQNYMKYDPKFGGTITARAALKPTSNDSCDPTDPTKPCDGYASDFYNGQYTDHHFHYGYFLYAASVLAKYDPVWLAQYKEAVNLLARDIANPTSEQDSYYTQYRYFDWFEGHGFANGLGPQGSGRNQESTSEAINAWYGLTLWGTVTGNNDLANIGRIMTALEARSAQTWTQVNPTDTIYEPFAVTEKTGNNPQNAAINMKDYIVSGINWSLKIDHTTFFGLIKPYLIGIQLMPYTPISDVLIDKNWASAIDTNGNENIIQQATDTLLTTIGYFHSDTNPNIFNYYNNVEWSEYQKKNSNADIKKYWDALEGHLNGAMQWGLITMPAVAVSNPSTAYDYLAFNTNGKFFNAMQAANSSFENLARTGSGNVTLYGLTNLMPQDARTCKPDVNGGAIPYCYTTSNQQGSIGWPIAKANYDGIDKGETVTNLLWWAFTHTPADDPKKNPAIFWLDTNVQVQNITATTATISWNPATIINDINNQSMLVYDVIGFLPEGTYITNTSMKFSGLKPNTTYLVKISARDKNNIIKIPGTTTTAFINTYVSFKTLDNSITKIIQFLAGPITYQWTESSKTIQLSWPPAQVCDNEGNNCVLDNSITYDVQNQGSSIPTCSGLNSATCQINDIDPTNTYNLTIFANAANAQSQSLSYSFQVNPSFSWFDPNVQATPGDDSVTISWNPVSISSPNPPNPTINYIATVTPGDYQCKATDATSCIVSNLTAGSYSVIVTASNYNNSNSLTSPAIDFAIGGSSLTWDGDTFTATLTPDGKQAVINWPTATLKNGTGPVQYTVTFPGTPGCSVADTTSCNIDVSQLNPGQYPISVVASAEDGNLVTHPLNTGLNIPLIPPPPVTTEFSACRQPQVPSRIWISFVATPSNLSSMSVNGNNIAYQGSGSKYAIDLPRGTVPSTLTVYFGSDSTRESITHPISVSSSCK